jgi:hypothetical protein
MAAGVSLIVCDNTNMRLSEAKPYVDLADRYGYSVEIKEPQTPWKLDAEELARRNTHGVPLDVIEGMIENYHKNSPFTVDKIRESDSFEAEMEKKVLAAARRPDYDPHQMPLKLEPRKPELKPSPSKPQKLKRGPLRYMQQPPQYPDPYYHPPPPQWRINGGCCFRAEPHREKEGWLFCPEHGERSPEEIEKACWGDKKASWYGRALKKEARL